MELNTPKMSSEEIIKNFIMHEKIATCNKKTKMFIYLSILQNQHLCIMTDYYWFCVCEGLMSVTGCEVSKFVENIQDTFEQCAQYYLRNKVKEFYDVHRKNLLLQKKIMAIIPAFQEVLDKEYQYKFTYQGHRYNSYEFGQQYGPWFFESVRNSKNFHFRSFNIFDKKNNYDRFTCS